LTRAATRADRWRWLLALGLLCGWLQALGATLAIPQDDAPLRVGRALEAARDPQATWSLADAMAHGDEFAPVQDGKFSAGTSPSAWWFRMELENPDDTRIRRLLRVEPARLEQVTVYVPDAAALDVDTRRVSTAMPGWWALRNGMAVPVAERVTPDRPHNFPLSLPAGKTTIYVRVESRGLITLQPSLVTPEYAEKQDRVQDLGMMAIFGGLAVLAVSALLVAVMARERIIACYGLMILFYLIYEMGVQGYGAVYLWPGRPQDSLFLFNIMSHAEVICGVQLLQLATQSKRLSPIAHRLLDVCKFLIVGLLLIAPLLPLGTLVTAGLNVSLVVLVVFVGCLVFFAWKKSAPARMLLWSLLPVLVISSVRVGEFFSWYSLGGVAELLLPLGYLCSMLFFAALVANRLRTVQAQRLSQQADSLMQAAYAQEALERAIGARTRELRVAKERAERADMAKGHFLARMGHELRTPLHAILGYVQLLRRQRRADVALQTPLAIMEASGRHLLELINDVLDYSRGELASLVLRPAPTYLFSLLQSVTDQLARSDPSHRDRIRLDVADDLPRVVRVDGQRLRQVLLNLVGNALRHAPDGPVDLIVRRTQRNGAPCLYVEVRDEGQGIAPDDHERIFEAFSHDRTSPTATAGIGLGLTISRQLVRLMHGELSLFSVVGEGSRFFFSIPLDVAAEADVPRDHAAMPFGRYVGPTQHILVVDDVLDNQRFLADLLGEAGFEVTLAGNCDEARSALRLGGIDVALFDQFLPDGSGWTLLRDARACAPGMPALLLSAAPPLPPKDWGEDEPGFAACLLKPVDVDTLLAALSDCLGLSWPTDERDAERADGIAPAQDGVAARASLSAAVADGDIFAIEAWVAQHLDSDDGALSALARALTRAVEAMDLSAMQAIVDASAGTQASRRPEAGR
jgi:signal transduction histidine kinase/ActR/RegA family two-component response regulator